MPTPKFIAQDTLWAMELLKRKLEKIFLLARIEISSQSPHQHDEISIQENEYYCYIPDVGKF